MTNNEKVKQAINKNMASIYSALEQVGATLPEKKNLENVTLTIQDMKDKQILQENLAIMKSADLLNQVNHTEEEYLEAHKIIQEYMNLHLYGGIDEEH